MNTKIKNLISPKLIHIVKPKAPLTNNSSSKRFDFVKHFRDKIEIPTERKDSVMKKVVSKSSDRKFNDFKIISRPKVPETSKNHKNVRESK